MGDQSGLIYVLSNQSLPGVLKIGFTRGSVDRRCAKVSYDYMKNPPPQKERFVVEFAEEVSDCVDAERAVHYILDGCRVGSQEFFQISVDDARKVIKQVKKVGADWKPQDCRLVMQRRGSVGKHLSYRSKRYRNMYLYGWLVSNFDSLYERIGHLEADTSTDPLFTEVLDEWKPTLPCFYTGRRLTELGVAMEWDRVKAEVLKIREFGDREILWETRTMEKAGR